jgi:hypothetical protein
MRSTYGGGLGYLQGSGNDSTFRAMQARQAVIAGQILKSWKDERREQLAKYARQVGSLKRVSDGINELIVTKRGFSNLPSGRQGEDWRMAVERDFAQRADLANEMQKALVEDYRQRMLKAGVSTSTGFNFYDLRGPVFLEYPVNTPLRNSLPRWGRQNDGYGTAVHWMATTLGPGSSYAGASEGNRVAAAAPNNVPSVATYKEMGIERSVTFTAEFAGEGYTDNVADEHIRGYHEYILQEESLILGGNAGTATGNNGFALGTANTPAVALAASAGTPNDGGAGFANNTKVSVRVVELTMLGNPGNTQFGYQAAPTITGGLTPTFPRTNADSSGDTISGGMGQVSASSLVVTALTATPFVAAQVKPKPGAFAWVWFVDVTDASSPAAANAYITVITTVPFVSLGGATPGAQTAAATGLSADNSTQALDFDGLIAWAVKAGTFINQGDLTSTNPITGSAYNGKLNAGLAGVTGAPAVQEIDYDLLQLWNAFQSVSDAIYCSADAKRFITACLFKNSSATPAYRFEVSRDEQGNITGGFTVSSYKSLYSMKETGAEEIPLRLHPMLPPGTILYDKSQNPYPSSRLPGVRGMFVQRDVYGIEWPITSRKWTFGTYGHEVLGAYMPGMFTVRTGIIGVN